MKHLIFLTLVLNSIVVFSQNKFSKHELSINGFRNPSIGAEYRYKNVSAHAGYYLTNLSKGVTTRFVRTGMTVWVFPFRIGKKNEPSSFYASISYCRGLTRDYENKNAMMSEIGFRWVVYKGINIRIGVAALAANDEDIKFNPTPGISYSFFFK